MTEIAQRVEALAEALQQRHWQMATAESCTGGWIAKVLTDRAGSSNWFERGFVTYSNEAKNEQLGVDWALLEARGAVSEQVARAMAAGAIRNSLAQISVAVTGIAGPAGGSADKPVGTVFYAVAFSGGETRSGRWQFTGDRDSIRLATVVAALDAIIKGLSS